MTIIEKYTTVGTFKYSPPTKKFVDLICNTEYQSLGIFALDESSYLWAWGSGGSGSLGTGSIGGTANSFPASVLGGITWAKVACGNSCTFGLDQSSYIWSWGFNGYGSLGDGTIDNKSSPVSVIGDRQFIDIRVINYTVYALDSSSYLWSWGNNGSQGLLGDGTTAPKSSPVSVLGDKTWQKFPLKYTGNAFLDSSSYAWGWGSNTLGQAGDNSAANRSSPVSVVGGRQWNCLVGCRSTQATFAMDSSSFIWGWGSSTIGDGNTVARSSPVSLLGQNNFNFTRVIASISTPYTIGIDTSSRVWHWGPSVNAITYSSPVLYGDLQVKVKPDSVSIGYDNTARWATAITENNDIVSWGSNQGGQAGIGAGGALSAFPSKALTTASFTKLVVPWQGAAASTIALDSSSYIYTWGTFGVYLGESGAGLKYFPNVMRSMTPRKNILGD